MAGFGAKVKLSVDRSSTAKKEFNSQISGMINQIKISNQFVVLQKDMDRVRKNAQTMLNASTIKIKNVEIDCTQAVKKLRKDLQNVINSLSIKNGVTITGLVDPTGAGTMQTTIENVADAAAHGQEEVNRFNAQMTVLKATLSSLASSYKTVLPGGKNAIGDQAELDTITQQYTALLQKIEAVKSANTIASVDEVSALQQEATAIQSKIAQIEAARVAQEKADNDAVANAKKVAAERKQAEAEAAKATSDAIAQQKKERNDYYTLLQQINTLILQTKNNLASWSASSQGDTSSSYQDLEKYVAELETLKARLLAAGKASGSTKDYFKRLQTQVSLATTNIKEAGENTQTFSDRVGGLVKKFTSWLTISQIVMRLYRTLKQMVSVVVEVDTALTELKKVTDETDRTYEQFLDTAASRAKSIGATVSDVVTATADFARLGYGIEDASKLADAAIIYKNVGDGIEDITQASESIISTMQAFGIEADNVMTIVDKFNKVGNEFAISSTGIGDALLNSASALDAAGNTLDESIALITATNEVIQDPEKVGTALKTVTMYLRAAKTEAEEAGISTDGMANSVSELREELLMLTGNKVDIMADEEGTTFKSTIQILRELSSIWDTLTDTTQANITELIGGGVRNANVIAALFSNFDTVESVLEASANSTNSAIEENEKYLDSIGGKISEFKAAFQELSTNLIDSDIIKTVVSLGTHLISILNTVTELINTLGGLKTVLIAVSGILVAANIQSIGKAITNLSTIVTGVFGRLYNLYDLFSPLASQMAVVVPGVSKFSSALKILGITASTTQLAIGALAAVITVGIATFNAYQQHVQEQRDATVDAAKSAATASEELISLSNKYLELYDSMGVASNNQELLDAQDEIIDKLGLTKNEVEALTEEYGSLSDAIKATTVESLEKAERDLLGGMAVYKDDLFNVSQSSAFHAVFGDNDPDYIRVGRGQVKTGDNESVQDTYRRAIEALSNAGYDSSLSFDSLGRASFGVDIGKGEDFSSTEGVLKVYQDLGEALDVVKNEIGSDNEIYDALYEKYSSMTETVENYQDAVGDLNSNLAQQYMLNSLIGKEMPDTQQEFDNYRNSLVKAAQESGDFIGTDEEIADSIDAMLQKQSQFTEFYANELSQLSNSMVDVLDFSNMITGLDEAEDGLDGIISAMDKLNSGTALTKQQLASLALEYPKLLEQANLFTDGSIEGQRNLLNTILDLKEQEYDAEIEKKINELKATEEVINAQLDLETQKATLIEEIENWSADGTIANKAELVNKIAELNDLQGQNYVTEQDGELVVNQEALNAKANQETEYAEQATDNIWEPYAKVIVSAHNKGYEGGLEATGNYQTSLKKILSNITSNILTKFANAIKSATSGDVDGVESNKIYTVKTQEQLDEEIRGVVKNWTGMSKSTSDNLTIDFNSGGVYVNNQGLDNWVSGQKKALAERTAALKEYKASVVNAYKNLEALKGLNLTQIYGSEGSLSGSSSSSKKAVEEYIANIDEYYEAEKKLEAATERSESISKKLQHSDDLTEQIQLSSDLVDAYKEQIDAEQELMDLKRNTIEANADALRSLGFDVDYNASTNELLINNLEHLNELTASSAGEYDTLQEATNALRKETEELINTTEDLNDDNIEAASNIEDLGYTIQETKNDIIDYIEDVYDKQTDAYQKIIDLRKEMIESAKDELDYESDIADKVQEIAELQAKIDQLALDDSRSAKAERASLIEELEEKQKDLADTQSDHSTEAQTDALDKLSDDYTNNKEAELELLKNTVGTSEELWTAFYKTLLGQSASVGNSINEEIANAWINAANAVREYGESVNGLSTVGTVVSNIPKFHSGGVVDEANLGKEEALAVLQKGEVVLNDDKQNSLYKIIDFQAELSKRLGVAVGSFQMGLAPSVSIGETLSSLTHDIASVGAQNTVYEPHFEVNITHNGNMSDSDARAYGEQIAGVAIDKLYSAFERRGINSTKGSRLKP